MAVTVLCIYRPMLKCIRYYVRISDDKQVLHSFYLHASETNGIAVCSTLIISH